MRLGLQPVSSSSALRCKNEQSYIEILESMVYFTAIYSPQRKQKITQEIQHLIILLHLAYLFAVHIIIVNSSFKAVAQSAHVSVVFTLAYWPVVHGYTGIAEPPRCVVLAVLTHPAPAKIVFFWEQVKGGIVHTAICVTMTLTRDTTVGVYLVSTTEWFVVVKWLTAVTL